jgi:hypothetical protein
LVGRRQAVAEQRRHQPQVRFNGSQQGGPPGVGDRDLDAAPVVVGRAARNQARLLHPGKQPAHTAFAEQHTIPQLFLTRPHARQVGGHLTRLGTRDDVVIQQEYVADLKAQAASAIDTFNVADVYKSVDPANPWALFRGYLDGVAAQAAKAVTPRWIDRLGGADVYTLPNAYQLVESLRIDYGHLGAFGIHP